MQVFFVRMFHRFVRNDRGSFSIIFALSAVTLLLAIGLAVDYARLVNYQTRLANAADTAVLASIAEKSAGMQFAFDMRGPGVLPPALHESLSFFDANFAEDGWVSIKSVTPSVRMEGDRILSILNYEADVQLLFGGLFGMDHMPIKGTAQAQILIDPNIDFYLLLDNSPSMGLGATMADIDMLVANTPDRCAFACHATNTRDNNYNLAKALGLQMRIDVVRQAAQNLTLTAQSVRKSRTQYRMAVYSFGERAEAMGLTEVAGLSDNMSRVRSRTASLDLMTIPHQNFNNDQQTDFDRTLAELNSRIPGPGSGRAGDTPQEVVFLVSDGVGNSYKPNCTKKKFGNRCQEPIDTRACDAIKQRGIKIAVLYTTYLPLPNSWWYKEWIKPFQSEIGERMRACASTGMFFEVSPSQGIEEAMNELFLKTISMLRLTR